MTLLAPINAPSAYRIGWAAADRGEPETVNPYRQRRYRRQFKEGYSARRSEKGTPDARLSQ